MRQALLGGRQLEQRDAVEGPPVRLGHGAQLLFGLRQRDVEHAFVPARAIE
jgi:hypothetical protein